VTSVYWVYLRNHTPKHKLDPKVTRPYEVLETDGRTYLIGQTDCRTGLAATTWCRRDLWTPRTDPNNRKRQYQTRSNRVGPSLCSSGS